MYVPQNRSAWVIVPHGKTYLDARAGANLRSGQRGTLQVAVLPTFDMLLFGGTGDLVTRKLLPARYRRHAGSQVSPESRIYGIARTALSRTEYVSQAESACREFLGKEFDAAQWESFGRLLDYLRIDAAAGKDYAQLTNRLQDRAQFVRVFFFSTASKPGGITIR